MPQKNSTVIRNLCSNARKEIEKGERALAAAREVVNQIEQLATDIAGNDERLDPHLRKRKRSKQR